VSAEAADVNPVSAVALAPLAVDFAAVALALLAADEFRAETQVVAAVDFEAVVDYTF